MSKKDIIHYLIIISVFFFSCNKNKMKEIWEINLNKENGNSILYKIENIFTLNNSIYIRTYNSFKSYNQTSLELNWEIELSHWNIKPCFVNDLVLLTVENSLICLNNFDGKILWKINVPGKLILNSQLINNKCLIIANNYIYEYNMKGELINSYSIKIDFFNNETIKASYFDNDILYLNISATNRVDNLIAYNYIHGNVLWISEINHKNIYQFNNLTFNNSLLILSTDILDQKKYLFFDSIGKYYLNEYDINAYLIYETEKLLVANNKEICSLSLTDSKENWSIFNTDNLVVLKMLKQDELYYCLYKTKLLIFDENQKLQTELCFKENAEDIQFIDNNTILISFNNSIVKAYLLAK